MSSAQVGRNDLCPCNSGKKYKRCCYGAPATGYVRRLDVVPPLAGHPGSFVALYRYYCGPDGGQRRLDEEAILRDLSKPTGGHKSSAPNQAEPEGKWTPAAQLEPGDEIRTMDGWVTVERVVDTGRVETVYNLEIEGDHTKKP